MAGQQTVTRADLCEAVHEEVGLSRQECSALVERTLELIVESLERGDTVKLSGFGVFQVREKRARMGRNPKTGEPAAINPRRVISFRASQIMKSRVHDAVVEDLLDNAEREATGSVSRPASWSPRVRVLRCLTGDR